MRLTFEICYDGEFVTMSRPAKWTCRSSREVRDDKDIGIADEIERAVREVVRRNNEALAEDSSASGWSGGVVR